MKRKYSVPTISAAIGVILGWLVESFVSIPVSASVAASAGVLIQVLVSWAIPDELEAE